MINKERVEVLYEIGHTHAQQHQIEFTRVLTQPGIRVKHLMAIFLSRTVGNRIFCKNNSLTMTYREGELQNEMITLHIISCFLADLVQTEELMINSPPESRQAWYPNLLGFRDRQLHSKMQFLSLLTPQIMEALVSLGSVGIMVRIVDIIHSLIYGDLRGGQIIGLLEEIAFLALLLMAVYTERITNGKT